MTYIEDSRTIYLDDSQPLHEANATYMLMQALWRVGPHPEPWRYVTAQAWREALRLRNVIRMN